MSLRGNQWLGVLLLMGGLLVSHGAAQDERIGESGEMEQLLPPEVDPEWTREQEERAQEERAQEERAQEERAQEEMPPDRPTEETVEMPQAEMHETPPLRFVPDVIFEITVSGRPPRFNKRELRVRPFQIVEVTFSNELPAGSEEPVNWVLVEPSRERDAKELGTSDDPGDDEYHPAALARTRTIGPGEEAVVAFEAPDLPGKYIYTCTATPACHGLRGELLVKR